MPDMMLELACPTGPVCGVDEAGRGPWAGPVSAGAVILTLVIALVAVVFNRFFSFRGQD